MEDKFSEFCDLLENVINNRTNIDDCSKHCYELFVFLEKAKNDGYDVTKFKELEMREEYKEDNDYQKWFEKTKEIVSVLIDKFESNYK